MRPVRATTLTCKYVKIEKWNVVAPSGRGWGGGYCVTRGFAPGYMQLRFQRAFVAIFIFPYFNLSIFVAHATTNCAPKGQLLLAQGNALGQGYPTINAPCKGNCITLHASSNIRYTSFIFHISIFQSFKFNAVALTGRGNRRGCSLSQGAALGYMQLRFQRALIAIYGIPRPEGATTTSPGHRPGITYGKRNCAL
jgi:hypothetical protein